MTLASKSAAAQFARDRAEAVDEIVRRTFAPVMCDGCLMPIKQRTLLVVVGVGQFHDERCAALHGRWLAKMARNFGPLLKEKEHG